MSLKDWLKKIFTNQKPILVEELILVSARMLNKSVREIKSLDPKFTDEIALSRIMKAYEDVK